MFGFDPSDLNDCIKAMDDIKFKVHRYKIGRINHERLEIVFERVFYDGGFRLIVKGTGHKKEREHNKKLLE